ncbi:DUF2239 family protein [Phenylobacterium sp.]|jgi:hypothetical protein|uniref:DUF2239 family protein n=1 Tax=Phenylobacterium sp. TaxID=1871053 RepID=UPI002E34648B|nr:DUF2239 family protein [Phenylobacterium sp.]HEX2558954.1 DUF2239 family protein [Phenylobacterium sp.]
MDARRYTAFAGHRLLARGPAAEVAVALKAAYDRGEARLVTFEDAAGRPTDFDLRGSAAEIAARHAPAEAPKRGRPKLGVVAREITLLPRHWDWLAAQPGGASATLRRLVQAAMTDAEGPEARRQRLEAAYRVMSALAGDLAGFEEASRALFAGDLGKLDSLTAEWPADVRAYLAERLDGGEAPQG